MRLVPINGTFRKILFIRWFDINKIKSLSEMKGFFISYNLINFA